MDLTQGEYRPDQVTYEHLQLLTRHGPCIRDADGPADVDFSRLLLGWAVAIDSNTDEPNSGYFFWLGGDRIHYKAADLNENSSQSPKKSLGQLDLSR